ncbi:MAG: oligopeptide transporter, OPT family [Acidobacteriota bacterium]
MAQRLPENAYKELKSGEQYQPFVPAGRVIEEVTTRSLAAGMFMCVIFSFAATYLGLKVGQVFEAAIPISILAVGLGNLFRRKNTILENVIIQSIGAASGVVVAGAIFTIPALFMLELSPSLYQIFLVALLGGCLGIAFLIPLRRYFVAELHGKLPYPEATATTEVLVTGEAGGAQAKVLLGAMAIGGLYDFLVGSVTLWTENITLQSFEWGRALTEKAKIIFRVDGLSSLLGLGYIIGLRYSAIICAGSFFSCWLIVPLIGYIGQHVNVPVYPGTTPLSEMAAGDIFRTYARTIGIGAMACAGFIGIIKSARIILASFSLGFHEIFKGAKGVATNIRTDRDLRMSTVIMVIGITGVVLLVFFKTLTTFSIALVGILIAFILSFLFTTVAANATAIVGTNPVSGMTLVTLILGSLVLMKMGLEGRPGMFASLLIGGVVCTALSVAGGFITDLKIGYWIGSTPRNQERFKFTGIILAALFVGLAIFLINATDGWEKTPAPQAKLMKTIIESMMSQNPVPWILYGIGALISIVMQMIKISPLPVALGMYLPMEVNTPLIVGGFIAHLLENRAPDAKTGAARSARGTLIASGFIAGGALMGILGVVVRFFGLSQFISLGIPQVLDGKRWVDGTPAEWYARYGEPAGIALFALLSLYLYWDSRRARHAQ